MLQRTHIVGGSSPRLSPVPTFVDAETARTLREALADEKADRAREETLVLRKLAIRPRKADEIDAMLLAPLLRLVREGKVQRDNEGEVTVYSLPPEESTGYRTRMVTRNGRTFPVRTFEEYAPTNRLRMGAEHRAATMGDDGFPVDGPDRFSDERGAA